MSEQEELDALIEMGLTDEEIGYLMYIKETYR